MGAKKYRAWQNKLRLGHGKSVLYKKSLTHFLVKQIQTDLTYARLQSLLPQHNKESDVFRKDVEDRKQIQSSICKEPLKSAESFSSSKESCPTVIIEQHELNLFIRISTVRSCSGAQSELFEILEEQDLDILQAQGFSTDDRVFHTILVKFGALSELDLNPLSERLYSWAGKGQNTGLPN
ncbi:hypothetical protein SUGI_0125300 [Cryptomeria japonica]|uniref:uncharacterized protein LOC131054048 n=1 Tax=Cryptomeria japonica TaxID=3369 RepID=UPI002408C081|nr:uncharacterized protein LOC131054048 [Cryptomeria japonica]GLJ10277.1 hypothetical protein SUGI_0125300 [Cryptomeria japonica]